MRHLVENPNETDQKLAKDSFTALSKSKEIASKNKAAFVRIKLEETNESISIPTKALELLTNIIGTMANGKPIALLPTDTELSTQQAANLLNISRPHLIKLLESDHIPFHKVGSHRRIFLRDILTYDQAQKVKMRSDLDDLATEAQLLDLGYE
ncbi:MAG: excisionase family DNA-binding protein [Bacteroidota bacterium]